MQSSAEAMEVVSRILILWKNLLMKQKQLLAQCIV